MATNHSNEDSPYNEIAGLYNLCWERAYLPAALPALDKLFFSYLHPYAKVLDLCCGSGHITAELVRQGFQVTGADNSAKLIELARLRLPNVEFHVQDARQLKQNRTFHGVLSTYDSLNHFLTIEDLSQVFACVKKVLKPGGRFVFDMNMEEAYTLDLRQWTVDLGESNVGLVRGLYDPFLILRELRLFGSARRTEITAGGSAKPWLKSAATLNFRLSGHSSIVVFMMLRQCRHLWPGSPPTLELGACSSWLADDALGLDVF